MVQDASCTGFLIVVFKLVYAVMASESGHLLLASAASMRAFFHYCGRSPYPEARELAATLIFALGVIVFIKAREEKLANRLTGAAQCPEIRQYERIALGKAASTFQKRAA